MNKNLIKKIAVGVAGVLVVSLAFMGAKSMFDSKYEKKGVQAPVSTAPVADRIPAKATENDDHLSNLNFINEFAGKSTDLIKNATELYKGLGAGRKYDKNSPLAKTMYDQSNAIADVAPTPTMSSMHSRFVTNGLGSLDAALDIMQADPQGALGLLDEFIYETGLSIDFLNKYMK